MATVKSASIKVGGKKVDPYHVAIQQRSDGHHRFEITVSTEKVEGDATTTSIDNSISHVGKAAEVTIERAGGNLKFVGIITTVHIDRSYASDSFIVFGGHGPTYLMEDGEGTKSYEEKDIATIANEILGTYPIKSQINPQYGGVIPYITRYKETNYQFLNRIAATYGEWFYYDGQGVVFGKISDSGSIDLTLGKDLDSFDYGVQLRPSKFKYQFYKYQENRMLENASTGFKPGWLDDYGKQALDASDSIFPNEPINPTWQDTQEDAVIKHLVEARKSSIVSDLAFFKGQSTNPGVAVAGKIRCKVVNKVNGKNQEDIIGNFRVTAVTHHLDANKDYRNSFEAIPITVTAPLASKNVFKPEAESQVAIVKENDDPDKLGRVRVQFKWQTGIEMTPWIRQISNHASLDRGVYFVPELEDQVYIDFVQGNPDRPYMQGAVHHVETPPEYFDPDNNFKSIKTRTGHTVLFDDTEGKESITIKDKSENIIFIDTAEKSITITAPENMTLNCKNMAINVEEDMITRVGGNMESTIEGDTTFTTTKETTIKSDGNINVKTPQKVDITGTGGVTVSSSATTEVKGTTSVKVNGAMAEVKASTKLDLKGGALANMKAAIIKIN